MSAVPAVRDAEPPSVTASSIVTFRPLFVREPVSADEDWIVGHEPSDICIALPEAGVIAIRELQRGGSVTDVGLAVRQQCGEDIDVADFVTALAQVGLVATIDGQSTGEVQVIGQRWLERIRPEWVSWLFSWPTLLFVSLLIVAGPLTLLLDPGARPQPTDILWAPSYTIDLWTLVVVGWLLVLKHELGHLLTARAKGLAGELTLGRRLFYLVVVSRIAGIWKLPRRERLLIYSAGMLSDTASAGILALVLAAADAHLMPLAPPLHLLLRFFLISEYVGIAWEFQIFMKTDVYHIVADLTGLHDLPERAHAWLVSLRGRLFPALRRKRWAISRREPTTPTDTSTRRDAAYWITAGYALIQVVGVTCSFLYLLLYLLPANVAAIQSEVRMIATSIPQRELLPLLDSLVALAMQAFVYGFLARSLAKRYGLRRRMRRALARQGTRRRGGALQMDGATNVTD